MKKKLEFPKTDDNIVEIGKDLNLKYRYTLNLVTGDVERHDKD